MLVDFQCPDLRFQRGSRNAEFSSGARGPVYASSAFAQGSLNGGLLLSRRPVEEAWLDKGIGDEGLSGDGASQRSRIYRTREHSTVREAMQAPTFWLLTLAAVGESATVGAAI